MHIKKNRYQNTHLDGKGRGAPASQGQREAAQR